MHQIYTYIVYTYIYIYMKICLHVCRKEAAPSAPRRAWKEEDLNCVRKGIRKGVRKDVCSYVRR